MYKRTKPRNMKTLILILLLLTNIAIGQTFKEYVRDNWKPAVCLGVSGAFDGTAEAIRYHYPQVKKLLPGINDQFWNTSLSWKNKYKNGDPAQGDAYFLSSTALVFTTDAFHLFRMCSNVAMIGAVVIKIGEKKKWYYYFIDASIYYISYNVGFTLIYDVIL